MNVKSKIIFGIGALIICMLLIFLDLKIHNDNQMDWLYISLLNLAILGVPLFLTAGIFSAYQKSYLNRYPKQKKHVDWGNYVLPMSLFVGISVILMIGLLRYDAQGSVYFAEEETTSVRNVLPSLVLGRASIPLYFAVGGNYASIRFPTAIFWAALIGVWISMLGSIMRRYTIEHLVARTYLHGAMKILYAMIASALFFLAVLAWPETLGQAEIDPVAKRHLLVLFAFFAGMFPSTIIQWIERKLRVQLNLGGVMQFQLTEIQGLDPDLATFLYEEGVWSINDLASRNPDELAESIHLDRDLIMDWQKQARLIKELGDKNLVERFRRLGINDWDDLAVLSGINVKTKLSDLTKTADTSQEISPLLIKILKQKFQESE